MPELPEIEVSRQGLLPYLSGQRIVGAVARVAKLRHPIPAEIDQRVQGLKIDTLQRRGKYLLIDCASTQGGGWLILHLGMSGSLRLVPHGLAAQKHDHFDLLLEKNILRLRDPRRFGALLWHEGASIDDHPLLAPLGVEPLSDAFDADHLFSITRRRWLPIKPLLMDNRLLVGVGNIYASESLFHAGISPLRPAERIDRPGCRTLVEAIRNTLQASIAAGGSSVRDYVHSDGGAGCYQLSCAVYGRQGQPCHTCGTLITLIRQAGRSTYHCPECQV